ncbi:MAG: SusC/RagA family TonB-linked outer membrane protein, partial [Bacteroidales bacterium]|nr:SusC/RagA family TonB-linked outer membrane protein [Bacteroidales bacterium]
IPSGDHVVIVSLLGMITQEIAVSAGTKISVVLEEASIELEEAVIVGYGQQKKKSVVGAITQASGDELRKSGGVTNLGAALTGKLPGVITYQSTGQPGEEDPKIIIRAQTSWNSSDPLILVDGVERDMSDVDISSVESLSVLKDASATAVYGVRGANGVILITTKRGKEGKANIQVRANSTMKIPSKLPEKYDSYGALSLLNKTIVNELDVNDASWDSYTPLDVIDKYRYPANDTEADRYPNVDWEDELLKDFCMSYNASVNVSGGTKFAKYFAAVDLLNEGDIFKIYDNGDGYKSGFAYNRVNVRSNLDFQLTKTTQFSSNLFGSNAVKKTPWNFSGSYPWLAIYKTAPDAMNVIYSNDMWGFCEPDDADQTNSVYELATSGLENQTTTKITSDFNLKQDLGFVTKGLSFEATYSYDNTFLEVDRGINNQYNNQNRMYVYPETGVETTKYEIVSSTNFDYINQVVWDTEAGSVSTGNTYRRQYYSMRLNYDRTLKKHHVTGLGLFSREKSCYGSNFSRFREDWVFRTTYSYNDKYLFEANGAYNGSEKFGPDYRFDFFPSLSLGWVMSEEEFMNNLSFVDMLKFRGSWGIIGDDSAGDRFLYADEWEYRGNSILGSKMGNTSLYTYYRQTQNGNPDISWETVEKRNLGLNYAFFDGLVVGSFDFFKDHRTNIIVGENGRAVASYLGGSVPDANIGEVKGQGYEFELRLNKMIGRNLRLWANINMNHAENEIIFADDPELMPDYQKSEGYSINQTHSYIDNGYLSTWDDVLGSSERSTYNDSKLVGDYNIVDYNGDGVIDSDDAVPYKYSSTPQNTYSTTLGAYWKGLNFSFQFYGVKNVSRNVNFPTFNGTTHNAYVEGSYWRVGEGGDVPMPRYNTTQGTEASGTRYYYDGSYLRLKTAELGYTFTDGWVNRVGMKSCKLYLSGNKLFLWTDMPDDRESNFSGGSSTGAYPTFKRVTLGVDITF